MTLEGLNQRFIAMKHKAESTGPLAAADAMAESGKQIVQELLSRPGRSAPGMPPGLQSGHLRDTMMVTPAFMIGDAMAEAQVFPTAVYARVLEFGGLLWPGSHTFLKIQGGGKPNAYAKTVFIAERPYMRRMRQDGIASGEFKRVSKEAFIATVVDL